LKTLLYLHGFVSSPQSRKALMLGDYLRGQATGVDYRVPELHHRPSLAIEQVHSACAGRPPEDLALIGSSLGGFYATAVAEAIGCKAVLLNPAVHPHRHFGRLVGPQTNLYTGETFVLTHEHVADLKSLDVPKITHPERYWLVVETGDEVLDYREAVEYYDGAFHTVVQGGDHSVASFPEQLPSLVEWLIG